MRLAMPLHAVLHLCALLPQPPGVSFDDLRHLPPTEVCSYAVDAAKAAWTLARLREDADLPRAAHWHDARCEASVAREAWGLLRAAHAGEDRADRLDALDQLRRLLGAEAWAQGRMPCPVPLHRFPHVD